MREARNLVIYTAIHINTGHGRISRSHKGCSDVKTGLKYKATYAPHICSIDINVWLSKLCILIQLNTIFIMWRPILLWYPMCFIVVKTINGGQLHPTLDSELLRGLLPWTLSHIPSDHLKRVRESGSPTETTVLTADILPICNDLEQNINSQGSMRRKRRGLRAGDPFRCAMELTSARFWRITFTSSSLQSRKTPRWWVNNPTVEKCANGYIFQTTQHAYRCIRHHCYDIIISESALTT